jgi:hypothetical protein
MMNVKSREVWNWPEWQALAARLGIPRERGITGCAVVLDCKTDANVFVDLEYLPKALLARLRKDK